MKKGIQILSYSKSIIILLMIVFSTPEYMGQTTLPFSRTTWGGTEPTGWTNTGCTQRTTSFACTGNDGTTFDTNGDSRMVFFNSAPNQLVFKLKKSSMSGASSLLVQESPDGSSWTNIGNFGTATGATSITDCGDITITLNCLSRYVKWTYTKSTGNCDMDDVSISLYSGACGGGTSHTVTFNANGGSGSMLAQAASATTNLTNNTFTNGSCAFNGWNTATNGNGTAYSNGQAYSFAADLTLYAQWNCGGGNMCPYIQAAVINACAGSCSGEGNNEFVVMNSGSYSIPVNGTDLNLVYNNGSDQFFTQSYAPQPGVISNLNSLAGCGTLFVDVSSGTIPANSTFFIMNQGSCFNSGSFSAYCGLGTIYVAFSSDATWSTGGFFGNNNSSRFFKTNFTTVNAGCAAVTYSYNNSNEYSFGADGASVVFNGATPSYVDGGGNCVPPFTILPIELLDFYATKNNDGSNQVVWKVAEEENINYYTIEKSNNGVDFTAMGIVFPSATFVTTSKNYFFVDENPFSDITYYRLSTKESNESTKYYQIISVDEKSSDWNYTSYQNTDYLILEFKNLVPKNTTLSIYDLSGKLIVIKDISSYLTAIDTQNFSSGIYVAKIESPYKIENFKLVVSK